MIAREANLDIVGHMGQPVGVLRISLLPRANAADAIPPLVDLRLEADRDIELEPVQLLEGHEYRYEISLDSHPYPHPLETDRPEVFEADSELGDRGRLRPRLYTGRLPVTIRAGGSDLGSVSFEVRCRKLDYLRHYRWMLADVAEQCAELVMERFAPTEQRFAVDSTRDAATLYQRFAFLQSLLSGDSFDASIHQILSRPHRTWIETEELRRPGQGIRGSAQVARQLGRGGPRQTWRGDGSGTRASLPTRIRVARSEETIDTPANRFVKFALTRWRDTAIDIGAILGREKPTAPVTRGRREVEMLTNRLDALLSHDLFREVGPLSQFPAGDQVLQKRAGYRDVFRTYVQFEAAALLSWQGGEEVYGAGQRDVATLYEFWVFLQLARVIARISGGSVDLAPLVQVHSDGLCVGLRRGRQVAVSGMLERLGRTLHLELWFNRNFATRGSDPESWTRRMRPDCSLRVGIDKTSAAPFDQGEAVWLHFDAKYRVEDLTQVFGDSSDDGEVGLTLGDDGEVAAPGESKRTDLLKMHAYRDAIRRSVGAYVLYPGTEREDRRLYREILPGLGAFALRPTECGEAQGIAALEGFIKDVVDHVALQSTQHERERFWVREAHRSRAISTSRRQAAPFLRRPPADTVVLLGFVKSRAHFEWIRRARLYNLRADDKRRGRVGLGSRELAAEFVVLYRSPVDDLELWTVTGEPRLLSREDLLEANYPGSRGQIYYCLEIEPLAVPASLGLTAARVRDVVDRAEGRIHGAPVAVTWNELFA